MESTYCPCKGCGTPLSFQPCEVAWLKEGVEVIIRCQESGCGFEHVIGPQGIKQTYRMSGLSDNRE